MDRHTDKQDLLVTLSGQELLGLGLSAAAPAGTPLSEIVPPLVWRSLGREGVPPRGELAGHGPSGMTLRFPGAAQDGDASTVAGYSLPSLTAELVRPGFLSLLLAAPNWEYPSVIAGLAKEQARLGHRSLLSFVDHVPPNPPRLPGTLVLLFPEVPGEAVSADRIGMACRTEACERVFVNRIDLLADATREGGNAGLVAAQEALSDLARETGAAVVAVLPLVGDATAGQALARVRKDTVVLELLGRGRFERRS